TGRAAVPQRAMRLRETRPATRPRAQPPWRKASSSWEPPFPSQTHQYPQFLTGNPWESSLAAIRAKDNVAGHGLKVLRPDAGADRSPTYADVSEMGDASRRARLRRLVARGHR